MNFLRIILQSRELTEEFIKDCLLITGFIAIALSLINQPIPNTNLAIAYLCMGIIINPITKAPSFAKHIVEIMALIGLVKVLLVYLTNL